jgi:peptidoglycan hydrolase-like protein with peptidoglycan-binding domain
MTTPTTGTPTTGTPTTGTPTTGTPTTGTPTAPPPTTRARTAVIAAVGVLVGAGIAAGLVLGLGDGSTQQPVTPAPTPAARTTPAAHQTAPANHETPAPKPAPAVTPSPAIETLQRELGQLNYYEGPITGTMNTQTVDAIKYLQRDAGLPQTGTMDAATQQALVTMLAHGNNQMGS